MTGLFRTRTWIFACLLPTLLGAARQTRDAAAVATGSASLSGTVVGADDSKAPLRRAVVTVAGPGLGISRSVVTDDAGHFQFDRLPAGSFTVSAAKAAYLTSAYGARRPGRPGTPVAIGADQHVTGITVALARGGVIAGTLHTSDGSPFPGVQVLAERNGTPVPMATVLGNQPNPHAATTDDRGEYRLYGLEPGSYVVVALMTSAQLSELHRRTTAELDALYRDAQQKGLAPIPPPTPLPLFTVAPVYYPGTAVLAQAAHVDVAVGAVRDDVSFSLEPVPSAALEGVIDRPAQASGPVMLYISGADAAMPAAFTMAPVLVERPGPDGKFRYVNVAPGHYTMTALVTGAAAGSPPASAPGNGTFVSGPGAPATASSPVWWATSEVTVAGTDLGGISLLLQPGLTVAGQVVVDATTLPAPKDLTTLRVSLDPETSVGSASMNGTLFGGPQRAGFARLAEDGTFEITGLTPGRYRVNVTAPGTTALNGFWTRSALVEDHDVLDTLVTLAAGRNIARAVVTLTDRHTEIGGTLQTPEGQPAAAYFVVALPTDSALWSANGRRVRSTRPATDGHYAFADLPPGAYLIAAVDDLEPSDLADPTFLQTIAPSAVPVTLGEGETKRQDLRLR